MQNFYKTPFQIIENAGNNAFCFDKTKNPTIYIPSIISLDLEEFQKNTDKYLKIGENTVFREKNKNTNQIIEYKGLQNFLEIKGEDQTIYIIDNHNHALYFRYKEYFAGNIQKGSELIHIDQHTDMNDNKFSIKKAEIENIFKFTNNNCNVGNFIKPAVEEGLIGKTTQINTEYSLLNNKIFINSKIILDIDLDFRAPEMSIEDYKKTINITKNLIKTSMVVTIATSPYFLDQNLAIRIIQDLFK